MNENTETKLQEAQAVVAEMRQELTKAEGDLARLDTTSGNLEKAVDAQIRLQTKRDVLQKRLEIATAAAEELRGDMLLAREADLRGQVKAIDVELDAAKTDARATLMKMIGGRVLAPHENAHIIGVLELFKPVAETKERLEAVKRLYEHAGNAASDVKRARAIAESQERAQIQQQIFAENQ